MGQCTELGTGHVFFRIPKAGYVEKARAKTNMETHPDPPLRILSGNKTHFQLPSDRLTLPPQVKANIDDHCENECLPCGKIMCAILYRRLLLGGKCVRVGI